jgi:hypothetical protein
MRKCFLITIPILFGGFLFGRNPPVRPYDLDVSIILMNPRPLPLKNLKNPSIESVFRGFDAKAIHNAITANDARNLTSVITKHSSMLSTYIKQRYNVDCTEDEDVPEATMVFGLFYYGKEKNLGEISDVDTPNQGRNAGDEIGSELAAGDPFSCLLGALGSLGTFNEIKSLYNDFVHGVTPQTIIRSLKIMLKRVASVVTILIAVYGFGDCLNWW